MHRNNYTYRLKNNEGNTPLLIGGKMDKLIDELKNMLVKAKLYTYEKLNKMGDVTIQAKFMEHFEILETTNILKK